jgi:alkanesulfonate monooxygenase SsuD/methylene tetrahydromethanopterin reductase-like flavin-dependent oxidoreductase (luciferase family)
MIMPTSWPVGKTDPWKRPKLGPWLSDPDKIVQYDAIFTEDEFDFDGTYYTLTGTINEPKPIQRPGPPILVGGSGDRLLKLVAEQADVWNVPGPPHASLEFLADRMRVLDRHCADLGRDPASITRSVQVLVSGDNPAVARATAAELVGAGFGHIVFGVLPPAPDNVARWLADEVLPEVSVDAGDA